jgi:hypothetical protein
VLTDKLIGSVQPSQHSDEDTGWTTEESWFNFQQGHKVLLQGVQTGRAVDPDSFSIGSRCFFPGAKNGRALS